MYNLFQTMIVAQRITRTNIRTKYFYAYQLNSNY